MLNVFGVDQKIASRTSIIFHAPTPQNENVKRNARNRDDRIYHELYQIKWSEHVVNTFFNNNLLESRLMSLTETILSNKLFLKSGKMETRIPKN